jgi:hypothetical protein
MLVKIVILFLGGMAVVAMIGNLLFPGAMSRRVGRMRRRALAKPATCPRCGKYIIGRGGCDGCTPARKG